MASEICGCAGVGGCHFGGVRGGGCVCFDMRGSKFPELMGQGDSAGDFYVAEC